MNSLSNPLPIGPALLLLSVVGSGFAGDAASPVSTAAPNLDYLLTLGPYGALVWGAYLLGRGVKLTIQVELSESDRELLRKLGGGGQP